MSSFSSSAPGRSLLLPSTSTGMPANCGLSSRLCSSFRDASILSASAASTMYLERRTLGHFSIATDAIQIGSQSVNTTYPTGLGVGATSNNFKSGVGVSVVPGVVAPLLSKYNSNFNLFFSYFVNNYQLMYKLKCFIYVNPMGAAFFCHLCMPSVQLKT